MNPTVDTGPRTTATSAAEGRLKIATGKQSIKKSKLKFIVNKYKKV